MSKKLLILSFIVYSFTINGFSQTKSHFQNYDHFLGIQINPYIFIDDITMTGRTYIYSLRYGVENNKGFVIGTEVSCQTFELSPVLSITMNMGLFGRYRLLKEKKISLFAEVCGYYRLNKLKTNESYSVDNGFFYNKWTKMGFSGYIAPGASFSLYKKIVTLDLMVKFSPDFLITNYKIVPSFKINYYFGNKIN